MQLATDTLADYALEITFEDLPEEVIETAIRRIIDSLGVAIGSFDTDPIVALRDAYGHLDVDENGATVLGTTNTIDVAHAGLINASMIRYLDFNDTYMSAYGGTHPSDHIGSLLAVAEAEGASGADLLAALVVAYEIQCRGLDTGAMWTQGFDYVVWGAYAGAAATGKLMGLDRETLQHAIGIAATSSNGLLAARMGTVSMWKGLAQPYAQHNAIQACQMAKSGVTGPTDAFEVPIGGVFDALTGSTVEFDALGGRDGEFKILETAIKPYPTGYGSHPAVSGILEFQRSHELDVEEITAIDVRTVSEMVDVYATPERWDPEQSRESADHSLPYSIAITLIDGEMTLKQFAESRLRDERVHALMEKITVEADEEMDAERRSHPRRVPTRIEIATDDERYDIETGTAPGHPEDPISDEKLEAKFERLTEPYLSPEQQAEALELCYDLADVSNVKTLPASLAIR